MRAGGRVAQQMAVEMLFAQKGLATARVIADKGPRHSHSRGLMDLYSTAVGQVQEWDGLLDQLTGRKLPNQWLVN
jgi:hypothetical protein